MRKIESRIQINYVEELKSIIKELSNLNFFDLEKTNNNFSNILSRIKYLAKSKMKNEFLYNWMIFELNGYEPYKRELVQNKMNQKQKASYLKAEKKRAYLNGNVLISIPELESELYRCKLSIETPINLPKPPDPPEINLYNINLEGLIKYHFKKLDYYVLAKLLSNNKNSSNMFIEISKFLIMMKDEILNYLLENYGNIIEENKNSDTLFS